MKNLKFKNTNNQEEEEEEDLDTSEELMEVIDNHIYFYNEVNNNTAFKLNLALHKLIKKHKLMSIQYDSEYIPIKLHINSVGGEVSAAFSIVDTILTSEVPIHTIIEGEAVSAATIISVVGHKRYMNKNAHMLIHQIRAGFWGKMDECTDEMKNIKKYMKKIKNIYQDNTNLSEDKLENILKKIFIGVVNYV